MPTNNVIGVMILKIKYLGWALESRVVLTYIDPTSHLPSTPAA